MELSIECSKRAPKAKPNALRREGLMPVVLYGHKGTESMSLTMDQKDAEILLRKASVNNTLINVNVPDMSWKGKALLREVQAHPWKSMVYHLSFFAVKATDSIEANVALNFVGEPKGVREEGGVLNTELNEITLKCKAGDIPEGIDVDVSDMGLGDTLTLSQLVLPADSEAIGEPDQAIATVLQPRKPETEAAPAEEDPEVAAVLEAMSGSESESEEAES